MRQVVWLCGMIGLAMAIGLAGAPGASAQDSGESCRTLYLRATSAAMGACAAMENGAACAASGEVIFETTGGQVINSPGFVAPLDQIAAIRALPGDGTAWSLARLHLPDTVDPRAYATALLIGPAALEVEAVGGRSGAVITLTGESDPAPCADLARPGLLVQSPDRNLTLLRVNGVDVAINGTALIQPLAPEGIVINAITRETILGQTGTVIFAGYSAQVIDGAIQPVTPYDAAAVAYVPVEVLPRMDIVALPGNAYARQTENLYRRPDPATYTSAVIRAGLPANILGQNMDGQWLYVRTYEGLTGWVPVYALEVNVPGEIPAYDSAPPLPLRPFGPVQARGVTTAEHNNLRDGPGQNYAIVVTLPLNSQVDIYARSPDNDWLLVQTPEGEWAWISRLILQPLTTLNLDEMPYSPDFPG